MACAFSLRALSGGGGVLGDAALGVVLGSAAAPWQRAAWRVGPAPGAAVLYPASLGVATFEDAAAAEAHVCDGGEGSAQWAWAPDGSLVVPLPPGGYETRYVVACASVRAVPAGPYCVPEWPAPLFASAGYGSNVTVVLGGVRWWVGGTDNCVEYPPPALGDATPCASEVVAIAGTSTETCTCSRSGARRGRRRPALGLLAAIAASLLMAA